MIISLVLRGGGSAHRPFELQTLTLVAKTGHLRDGRALSPPFRVVPPLFRKLRGGDIVLES